MENSMLFYGKIYVTCISATDLQCDLKNGQELKPYLVIFVDEQEKSKVCYEKYQVKKLATNWYKHFSDNQRQKATNSPNWNRSCIEIFVDEMDDENLLLCVYNNTERKPHTQIAQLSLSIGQLAEKLNLCKDDKLSFDQEFPTGGSIQFEIKMTEERAKFDRPNAVPKMYPIRGHKFRETKITGIPVCSICDQYLWLQQVFFS